LKTDYWCPFHSFLYLNISNSCIFVGKREREIERDRERERGPPKMSISPKKTKKTKKKPKSVRHGDWVQKLDPNSKRYYYGNVKTLERVWEMPEEFKLAAEAVAASSKTNAL
jgi:hypothetical protein